MLCDPEGYLGSRDREPSGSCENNRDGLDVFGTVGMEATWVIYVKRSIPWDKEAVCGSFCATLGVDRLAARQLRLGYRDIHLGTIIARVDREIIH